MAVSSLRAIQAAAPLGEERMGSMVLGSELAIKNQEIATSLQPSGKLKKAQAVERVIPVLRLLFCTLPYSREGQSHVLNLF